MTSLELHEEVTGRQQLVASVHVIAVDVAHGLYQVDRADNALAVSTDSLGRVIVQVPRGCKASDGVRGG